MENIQEKIERVAQFAKDQLETDKTGHDFSHIQRVADWSQKILETEPKADPLTTMVAAYLHDTYDDKLFDDVDAQKRKAADLLDELEIPSEPIFYIIDNMSWSKQQYGDARPLDINGQIVQDADRLEAVGVIAAIRAFIYGSAHGRKMYDPEVEAIVPTSKEEYRTHDESTVNHFYTKLFRVKDYMNTELAKKIAEERNEAMHAFLDQFLNEWNMNK
ncbi:MAG: HD domain-containing protein [Lactobacillaceae bacterium]|jgi:uncharacterized protein|nr:HD domain-containing protein [Lactobacillaceae bacterium]